MMNQSLSMSQVQQLQMVLAPQLRQSLEMLQVPILELRAMIQKELEQNPTIEEKISGKDTVEIEPGDGKTEEAKELDFAKEFEALASLDKEWRDYFFQDVQNKSFSKESDEKHQFVLDSLQQKESLQEHLLTQLTLAGISEKDTQLGQLIIGSIDSDGYLTTSPDELALSSGYDKEHMENIIALIQDFHPTGVGSKDLRECLLIQLERLEKTDTIAWKIVDKYLTKLGKRKIPDIAKSLKISIEEVKKATEFIATLDPKPGRAFTDEVSTYVLTEVVVEKINGKYVVILNDDQLPHIRISKHYRSLLENPSTKPKVKSYIRERIRSGAFLIKSIHQRQQTIFKIASEIVKTQTEFLDNGVSHLKPLTMADIAKTVGVHETTVSRAVSGKYMKTPKGVFEIKYFFTPGLKKQDGSQISNETVKDMIATMVANEDTSKPLSDQEIMTNLAENGINIARRTIAKYRLVLRIPPSHMRKGY